MVMLIPGTIFIVYCRTVSSVVVQKDHGVQEHSLPKVASLEVHRVVKKTIDTLYRFGN